MFTTEVPDEFSLASWVFQQFVSAYGPMVVVAMLGIQLGELSILGQAGLALSAALLLGRAHPRLTLEGRWVWAFPALFFASGYAFSLRQSGMEETTKIFFDLSQAGMSTLVLVMITYPLCNSMVYSICMHVLRRPSVDAGSGEP